MSQPNPSKDKPQTAVLADQYTGAVDPGNTAGGPVKERVEVQQVTGDVVVIDAKPGEVKWTDKVKAYWHTVITVIGALLVLLNQVTPITEQFGGNVQKIATTVIIFLTALLNFLKSNEVWVNKL